MAATAGAVQARGFFGGNVMTNDELILQWDKLYSKRPDLDWEEIQEFNKSRAEARLPPPACFKSSGITGGKWAYSQIKTKKLL